MKYGTPERALEHIVEQAAADRERKAEAIERGAWMSEAMEDAVIDALKALIETTGSKQAARS